MNGHRGSFKGTFSHGLIVVALLTLALLLVHSGPSMAARNATADSLPATEPLAGFPVPDDVFQVFQPRLSGADEMRVAFSDDITQTIVLQLQRGTSECNSLNPAYRLDCLRQVYSRAAGAAGNRPDYASAANELRRLSRTLNGIVRQNQDRKAGSHKQGGRSYKAVAQDALRRANSQAAQAIEEAATKLLRSAGNSQKRKVHYTRIANAVNSTKKILRS